MQAQQAALLAAFTLIVCPSSPAIASFAEPAASSEQGSLTPAKPLASAPPPDAGIAEKAKEAAPALPQDDATARRTQLNLKGATDTASGENRRNDNVPFNPIDNNTLRDLSLRLGFSPTIVQEFAPQNRYFSSEYGSRPELPIHGVSSFAQVVHGSFMETHGNSALSARSFFQVGTVKPAHENTFGFNFSMPFGKGVTLSLENEEQRSRGSVNGNVLVPNANERTPLTSDPRLMPIIQRMLSAYPAELPNRPDIDDRALNTNSPQIIYTDHAGGTLNLRFRERDRAVLRYRLTAQKVQSFEFVAGQNPNSAVQAHTARLTWNRTWSPDTVVDFSAGFDRVKTSLEPEPYAIGPAVMIFIIQALGSSTVPVERAVNDFQYAAKLEHTHGSHLFTAGFNSMRRQFNGREASNHLGSFLFTDAFGRDAVSNLRMGTPSSYSITIGDTARGFRNWTLGFYAGDKWRAAANLTLNFGLRYEPLTRPVEVNNLDTLPFGCDCNNLAPTFGFSFRLPGGWGTLRGAYGLFYSQLFPATYGQDRFNPPLNIGITVTQPDLAYPLAGLDIAHLNPATRSSLTAISPDLVLPYSHQYNLSWEPGAWNTVRLQLGYVGSRTPKLFTYWSSNRAVPSPGIPQTLGTVNDRRPDPDHFLIYRVGNGSRAYYDAARVSAILPGRDGFSLDISYWFSKSLDNNSDFSATGFGSIPPPQSDKLIQQDFKGRSNFDQPHSFLARGSYDVPEILGTPHWFRSAIGGWSISSVLLMKSGTPFTVFAGSDAPGFGNVDGESGDRVNVVDPSVLGRVIDNPDTSTAQLPRTAFAFMSPTDLRGNIGRNTFRKGRIWNVNAALLRSWKLSRNARIAFRVESVNLFNRPQFADPERNLSSKLFGRISNTLNVGRNFLFTLKLSF